MPPGSCASTRNLRASSLRSVKILTVVGNRPQFIKAAGVSGPPRAAHEELLVHTGQHYDDALLAEARAVLGAAPSDHGLHPAFP